MQYLVVQKKYSIYLFDFFFTSTTKLFIPFQAFVSLCLCGSLLFLKPQIASVSEIIPLMMLKTVRAFRPRRNCRSFQLKLQTTNHILTNETKGTLHSSQEGARRIRETTVRSYRLQRTGSLRVNPSALNPLLKATPSTGLLQSASNDRSATGTASLAPLGRGS